MRVLQLIDSLEVGGAERMAVNYANALKRQIGFSALVSTRKEGGLKEQLDPEVAYLFLGKKKTIDFKAIRKLKNFVIENKISVIHAHSSSFFLAVVIKILTKNIKVIWHDHYGNSDFLVSRKSIFLKLFSNFFDGIISVNKNLETWSKEHLNCEDVIVLNNFVHFNNAEKAITKLQGTSKKRIIHLANLRPQKNHDLLIEVAKKIKLDFPDWTFHLVGKDFEDDYSTLLKSKIASNNLTQTVFIYGACEDVEAILKKCDIGILTSVSEGLPVAILEYGYFKLPIIATNVGEISSVIKDDNSGFLVTSNDSEDFSKKLMQLMKDEDKRIAFAANLQKTIFENYTDAAVIDKYQKFIGGLS